MLYQLALAISGIAGLMAIALFYIGLKSKPKESLGILIFAVLFLGASFGGLEWSFYLLGYNMFTFFAFPLIAYFAVWFAFIIWIFERRKERYIWVLFLIAMIILIVLAVNCMNCLARI
jgi:asparagine N-glycosylation enzyme membrane subunit Stt3